MNFIIGTNMSGQEMDVIVNRIQNINKRNISQHDECLTFPTLSCTAYLKLILIWKRFVKFQKCSKHLISINA